jgi:hypothetical protein
LDEDQRSAPEEQREYAEFNYERGRSVVTGY